MEERLWHWIAASPKQARVACHTVACGCGRADKPASLFIGAQTSSTQIFAGFAWLFDPGMPLNVRLQPGPGGAINAEGNFDLRPSYFDAMAAPWDWSPKE
jgi:hypothetical protein